MAIRCWLYSIGSRIFIWNITGLTISSIIIIISSVSFIYWIWLYFGLSMNSFILDWFCLYFLLGFYWVWGLRIFIPRSLLCLCWCLICIWFVICFRNISSVVSQNRLGCLLRWLWLDILWLFFTFILNKLIG